MRGRVKINLKKSFEEEKEIRKKEKILRKKDLYIRCAISNYMEKNSLKGNEEEEWEKEYERNIKILFDKLNKS
jgi:hypothetical protein